MGYAIATGRCIGCCTVFSFNPHLVPSTRFVTGEREPLCRVCVDRLNTVRQANGLDRQEPLPGAYGPMNEGDL